MVSKSIILKISVLPIVEIKLIDNSSILYCKTVKLSYNVFTFPTICPSALLLNVDAGNGNRIRGYCQFCR